MTRTAYEAHILPALEDEPDDELVHHCPYDVLGCGYWNVWCEDCADELDIPDPNIIAKYEPEGERT